MRLARFTLAVAFLLAPAAMGAEEESGFKPGIDERSFQLLRKACDQLTEAGSFSFRAHINDDEMLPNAQKIQYTGTAEVSIRRPNRLKSDYDGERRKTTVWYDGETLTVLDRKHNLYATRPAKATIDETLDAVFEKHGFTIPLADLVCSDVCDGMMERVESLFYVGTRELDGQTIHHLAATQADIDWQIWLEEGKQVVPRKLVITYADEPGDPQWSAVLTEWNFAPQFPDKLFRFEPPEGALRIEFLPQKEPAAAVSEKEDGR